MPDTLGSRIKELRLKHAPEPYKLTLTGLAGMVGTSKGYLWDLENNKRKDPGDDCGGFADGGEGVT